MCGVFVCVCVCVCGVYVCVCVCGVCVYVCMCVVCVCMCVCGVCVWCGVRVCVWCGVRVCVCVVCVGVWCVCVCMCVSVAALIHNQTKIVAGTIGSSSSEQNMAHQHVLCSSSTTQTRRRTKRIYRMITADGNLLELLRCTKKKILLSKPDTLKPILMAARSAAVR